MFDFAAKSTAPAPKCYFTHSLLPPYIDPLHPPNKKHPFTTFAKQPYTHTLDLLLPSELYALIADELHASAYLHYARVYMKLADLLASEFLTYIKTANIAMLSEGRPGVDNVFSLRDGVLRLELDRQTYERCGLQGKPVEDGGRKHQRARWVVEVDLREKCMVAGRKGFGRLVRACEEVLDRSLTWLFWDISVQGKKDEACDGAMEGVEMEKRLIDKFHPFWYRVGPEVLRIDGVLVPKMEGEKMQELYEMETSMDLLEWLHLVGIDSPRVRQGDRIDEFLSRYRVPAFMSGNEKEDSARSRSLVRLRWRGFIPPAFVRELYLELRKNGIGTGKEQKIELDEKWFAMTANAFGGYGGCYTVLQFPGRDTMIWECN